MTSNNFQYTQRVDKTSFEIGKKNKLVSRLLYFSHILSKANPRRSNNEFFFLSFFPAYSVIAKNFKLNYNFLLNGWGLNSSLVGKMHLSNQLYQVFKYERINVLLTMLLTRCCKWRFQVVALLFGCNLRHYEKDKHCIWFYSALVKTRFLNLFWAFKAKLINNW